MLGIIAGEAGRMLRDAPTYPARRNERRPPLLSDRGERQGLGFILRHSDCQRYAAQRCTRLSSSFETSIASGCPVAFYTTRKLIIIDPSVFVFSPFWPFHLLLFIV